MGIGQKNRSLKKFSTVEQLAEKTLEAFLFTL